MNFVPDTTAGGRPFRCELVDDLTRECPLLLVDRSHPARRVVEALTILPLVRSRPQAIVCDSIPESVSLLLDQRAAARGIRLGFIRPGNRVQNCSIEGFKGKLRDESPNQFPFATLGKARHLSESGARSTMPTGRTGGQPNAPPAECAARSPPKNIFLTPGPPVLRWHTRGKGLKGAAHDHNLRKSRLSHRQMGKRFPTSPRQTRTHSGLAATQHLGETRTSPCCIMPSNVRTVRLALR